MEAPELPPRHLKPARCPQFAGDWQLLQKEVAVPQDTSDAVDMPTAPRRGDVNFVMYTPGPKPRPPKELPPLPPEDIWEELRELVAVQEEVEAVRRAELDACKQAEADPGPPLGPRGLWTMHKYKEEGKVGYAMLLLEHLFKVIEVVLGDECQAAGLQLLDKFLDDALKDVPVKDRLQTAFDTASHTVIVAACKQWTDTVASSTPEGALHAVEPQEVLAWVRDGEHSTSLTNVSILRLYKELLQLLQRAARRHIPVVQGAVDAYQQSYEELSRTLKETHAELASVSKVLGSLRTGMAAEESKLGVVQRQLGTLPALQCVVDIFPLAKALPHEWDKDSAFHLRSKYMKAKGANRELYVTGDEVLFTVKELTSVALLESCCVLIAPGYDVDDNLSSGSQEMEECVRSVLERISATWGDVIEAVLPGGRVSPHTYEVTYSVSHLISRLPAVKLILSNLLRIIKGDKPQHKEVLCLGMLDNTKAAELEMRENLSYILERCRHHVLTVCPELVCLYNWLVAVQAIADIAIRTTPEEEEVARLAQLVKKLKSQAESASSLLASNSIALSKLTFVVGSSPS